MSSVKFIHPIIAQLRIKSLKSHAVLYNNNNNNNNTIYIARIKAASRGARLSRLNKLMCL